MMTSGRIDLEKSRDALREILLRLLPDPGSYSTPVEGLLLHRYNSSAPLMPRFYQPVAIVVVQGKKRVRIGTEDIYYGEQSCFVAGLDMAVSSCVREANEDRPYLSLSLNLDKSLLATLAVNIPPSPDDTDRVSAGAAVHEITPELLDAFLRLLELAATPDHAAVLGNLVYQEIHFRLLTSPFGPQLRTLNTVGTRGNQIARAIAWLKSNYKNPIPVEELAGRAHMAPSTFHKHFKEITAISPLQYQKRLRLAEAQRMMLSGTMDVAQVAYSVGYESVTQFSREYKRLFGESPRKDVTRRRSASDETSYPTGFVRASGV